MSTNQSLAAVSAASTARPALQLSPHFSLREFCFSATAARLRIDNGLPLHLHAEARATAAMLERIRECAGGLPVRLNSGFRCLELNRALGSGDDSDHRKAMAADIEIPALGRPALLARLLELQLNELGIGQLILEYPDSADSGWVHVSTRPQAKAVNRVLTITRTGTRPGIHE